MEREKFVISATASEFYIIHRFMRFLRSQPAAAERMVAYLEYKESLGDFSPPAGPAKIFDFPKSEK